MEHVRLSRFPFGGRRQVAFKLLFANHFWVRLQEGYFSLSFGQAEVPRFEDFTEARLSQIRRDGVPIRIISRLAVPPDSAKSWNFSERGIHYSIRT
jgi:hypothetical protein